MNKTVDRLICRIAIFLVAIGLSLTSPAPFAPAAAADFVMKFGTATFNESQHQFIKFYKEAVEKASGGRIEVGSLSAQRARTDPAHDRWAAARHDRSLYRTG